MVYSMGKSVGNPIHMREKEEREKEKKENKVNKKVKPLGVTGRRHSADQLLSIANDNEEWKRFYGCVEKETKPKARRNISVPSFNSPEQENLYKNEKDKWKELCGFNSPCRNTNKFSESKSEGTLDLNMTQTVDLTQLSLKKRSNAKPTRTQKGKKENKGQLKPFHLPVIDEKHNTYHSNKSPVVIHRKCRFKQVQVQGINVKSMFHSIVANDISNRRLSYPSAL